MKNPRWLRWVGPLGALLALGFVLFAARAAVGLWGERGEVCMHLSAYAPLLEVTGKLTRCDAVSPGVYDVQGERGAARATVTFHRNEAGNTVFDETRWLSR